MDFRIKQYLEFFSHYEEFLIEKLLVILRSRIEEVSGDG